ncbi:2733_t:CDS:2, partial [Acaulospora colombiana]
MVDSDSKYLREAIPYILGSVGTLAFDVTIFLQWCAWRDPERRKSIRNSVIERGYRRISLDGDSSRTIGSDFKYIVAMINHGGE